MAQRFFAVLFIAALAITATSCKPAKKDVSAELDAKYRAERKVALIKTYQDLVKKYPESEYTPKAKERLAALGPAAPTPATKKK